MKPPANLSPYLSSMNNDNRLTKVNIKSLIKNKGSKKFIKIHKENLKQTVLGFGGSFTESSASIYHDLSQTKKDEIIEAYFGETGNNYSIGRTHINSCDFSLENYAHCETPGDIDLKKFSISRNKKDLIPFIKDALRLTKNKFRIMASPWSPPSWMKTNGQMNEGGKLKEEYKSAWADYYCKFIEFYHGEEVPIWGISVQNEPEAKQTWDSCLYTAEEERDFIKYFLGPSLERHNLLDKKVIIWDHNRDMMVERARTVLRDPEAAKFVWGTGFHWYCGDHFDNVQKVHDEFPDKNLIFTEGCQEGGPHLGSWDLGERYATSIINDLNRWTVAWLDWNLILNTQGGPNHVGNYCSAPMIVDTNTQEILYQSSYYYIGHFSRFIKQGDSILEIENDTSLLSLSSVSKNRDKVNTVILNKSNTSDSFTYIGANTSIDLTIPERSILTLIEKLNDN
ncbi:MAG: glucosylceramidase [Candidatus Marinimicrobia bacterium]|nr:glucosylceramidase [Candidatus Neomarinimicrobiota bacterium]